MNGLNLDEFKALQTTLGLDLEDPNTKHFLRLYGLIPTREQHLTVKNLTDQNIDMICIDQNPTALLIR